jgi:hypothetical protein
MNTQEIDKHIGLLIDILAQLQNQDGSFDTMYSFLYHPNDNVWKHWNKNNPPSGDSAFILYPLLSIKTEQSQKIIDKGINYVKKTSFRNFIWKYPDNRDLNVRMPFDLDSTVYCSYILSKTNISLNNKDFLNFFIKNHKYYLEYFFPLKLKLLNCLSFTYFIKIWYYNLTTTIFSTKQPLAKKDDWETASICNILLYVGRNPKNAGVWEKLKKDFIILNFKTIYYSKYYAVYAFARLCFNESHNDLLPSQKIITTNLNKLVNELSYSNNSLDFLFLANAILMLEKTFNEYFELFNYCLSKLKRGDCIEILTYYTGNSLIGNEESNSYFGSKAMTCSLYIEFLNLYKERKCGIIF